MTQLQINNNIEIEFRYARCPWGPSCAIHDLWIVNSRIFWIRRIPIFKISNIKPIYHQSHWNLTKTTQNSRNCAKDWRHLNTWPFTYLKLTTTRIMSQTFEFNVKNVNLRKWRIVADFFPKRWYVNFFTAFRRIEQLGLMKGPSKKNYPCTQIIALENGTVLWGIW
jgi:hypothetical protein